MAGCTVWEKQVLVANVNPATISNNFILIFINMVKKII
jgi:hypothetical protein